MKAEADLCTDNRRSRSRNKTNPRLLNTEYDLPFSANDAPPASHPQVSGPRNDGYDVARSGDLPSLASARPTVPFRRPTNNPAARATVPAAAPPSLTSSPAVAPVPSRRLNLSLVPQTNEYYASQAAAIPSLQADLFTQSSTPRPTTTFQQSISDLLANLYANDITREFTEARKHMEGLKRGRKELDEAKLYAEELKKEYGDSLKRKKVGGKKAGVSILEPKKKSKEAKAKISIVSEDRTESEDDVEPRNDDEVPGISAACCQDSEYICDKLFGPLLWKKN